MRFFLFLFTATLTLAQASWFGGSSNTDEPAYLAWDTDHLRSWLELHNVRLPKHTATQEELREWVASNWNVASSWTYDQYTSAQEVFSGIRDTSFDKWDESRLREFLLKQGVVAPKGPKEHLIQLAKSRYDSFMDAASSFSARASATASTAVYGDTQHQMSKSVSSIATTVHESALKSFDKSKDYVYSTWSDNEMRTWLEKKGFINTKSGKKEELLQMMHDAYGSVANPVWEAWSDSYLVCHSFLLSCNMSLIILC
jgi:Putative nuclear envelope organisation protein